MRANFTPALDQLLRRADSPIQLILEALVVARSDVRQRKAQWALADSLVGLTTRDDGLVQVGSVAATLVANATDNGTDAPGDLRATPGAMFAELTLAGTEPTDLQLTTITAFLDPVFGGAKTVDRWELHVYAVEYVLDPPQQGGGGESRLLEIGDPVQVVAGGAAGDVTFDYTTRGSPKIKLAGALGQLDGVPHVVFEVRGLKVDGTPATNIGWRRDTTKASVASVGGNVLRGVAFTPTTDPNLDHQGRYTRSDLVKTPRTAINAVSGIAAATLTFSTGGGTPNVIDLGGVPTATVEFGGKGFTPSGSAITYQVQADDATWLSYVDGQTTDDLTRLNPAHPTTKRQTYKVRATLTPNAGNNVSPLLQELAVREITAVRLDHLLANVSVEWSTDPITLKSNVARATFDVLADGAARDYRSAIEDLLSGNIVGTFDLRLWIGCILGIDGHTEVIDADKSNDEAQVLLPRSQWLLVDVFLVEDIESLAGGMRVIAVSPLSLAKGRLPKFNTATSKVESLQYTAQTLAFVWDDLLNGQLGLPARFYGQPITDVDPVTKKIDNSDVKRELDAIAYAGRGTATISQGRFSFKRLIDDPGVTTQGKAVIALVPFEECKWGTVSPGFRQRMPETFVRYGFDDTTGNYESEYRAFDATSLVKLRPATIDAQPQISEDVCRWLPADGVLAQKIAKAMNRALALGMIQVVFETTYPHPEWEIGDQIAVQVDRFAVADPNTAFAIRGMVWALPVLVAQLDPWGRRWVGWVRSYGDILSGAAAAVRLGLGDPPRTYSIVPTYDANGNVSALITGNDAALSVKVLAAIGSAPSAAAVRATAIHALDANHQYSTGTLITATDNDLVYIAVFPYETATGAGAEGDYGFILASHGPLRYQDGAGKHRRDMPMSDGEYAFGAHDPAGAEVVGNMYILAASDAIVGSAAAPSSKTKVIRFSSSVCLPQTETGKWAYSSAGTLSVNTTGVGLGAQYYSGMIILPRGVTITNFGAFLVRNAAGDTATITLYKNAGVLATCTQAAGVSGVVNAGLSQLIGSETYSVELTLVASAGAADAALGYLEFTYTMPNYAKSI